MMQRERAASAGAEAVTRPAGGYRTPPRSESVATTPAHAAPVWDNLYRALSPEQQRELLALAERQGLLYAHQLPVISNGTAVDSNRKLLAGVLNGAWDNLQPLQVEPIDVGDDELDGVQREAVAKALATPDIFLIRGRPGSGKSRVVAEIISRATARGARVLFVAATAAALDRVLEQVVPRELVFPVRCLDQDEQAASLAPAIHALTLPERIRVLGLQALNHARRQAELDEGQALRLRQDEPLWNQLKELARQAVAFEAECRALERQRDQLPGQVAEHAETEASATGNGFAHRIDELTRSLQQAEAHAQTQLAELRGQIETGRQEQAHLDSELRSLQPLAEAKQRRRWWTKDWWRAAIHGKKFLSQRAQLHDRCRQIQGDVDAAQNQIAIATREWEEAKARFAAERMELIAAELARRQADLDDRMAMLHHEQHILQQKWQNCCQALAVESPQPKEMTPQAVEQAHLDWCGQLEQTEARHALTRQWIACLEQTPEVLSTSLPGYFNLVAGTLTALPRDKHFGEGGAATRTEPDFDLLVVEEADQIPEPQFLQVVRRARRCVLIGQPAWPQIVGPWDGEVVRSWRGEVVNQEHHPTTALLHHLTTAPGPFQRLWQLLHCDPRQLPYVWLQEANRLCCRLRHVAPEQRQWITSEHVADSPSIELRILAAPHSPPTLAEVIFPPSFTIDRAKRYIFQELQELAVHASSSSLRWTDGKDQVVLRLADRDLAHGLVVELAPGIREILGTATPENKRQPEFKALPQRAPGADWQSCCVEFDRSAGWDRARAAAWVREHLGLCDQGRTISLDVCYRWSGSVEFVPVPAFSGSAAGQGHRNTGAGHRGTRTARATAVAPALPRKGGAGLEIDLADSRHRERLPAELRSDLPRRGFVNYQEAQAVVRTLANLLQEPDLREANGEGTLETCPTTRTQPAIAVLALYPAQAELIRHLMRRDERLAALDGMVEVGVPAAFRQREAAIVLVSLTRSHTHRAVAFGEGPQMLALAMTRARSKLLVFGDPGTLVRRSHWEGPVEHLDPEAAAHERQLVTRLVHLLR
jgi:hypothetical protein